MDEEKLELLRKLGTLELVQHMNRLEDELERQMREEATLKSLNAGYLGSYGSDCAEVERLLAELSLHAPEIITIDGKEKKTTAPDRVAWLTLQREKNREIDAAINRQHSIVFNLENIRIGIEMAKKRLEGIRAILALKTAQIEFLK